MPWLNDALKHLWKAAAGQEKPAVVSYTYVEVDKLPGVQNWRIKWRYHTSGPWVGFMPFTGTHQAAIAKALDFNATITARLRKAETDNNQTTKPTLKHVPGPRYNCPACKTGDRFHT